MDREMSVFGRESDSIEGDFKDEICSPFLQYCSCSKKHRRRHLRFLFCCRVRENFKGGRCLSPSATASDVPSELILLCPTSRPCHLGDHASQFFCSCRCSWRTLAIQAPIPSRLSFAFPPMRLFLEFYNHLSLRMHAKNLLLRHLQPLFRPACHARRGLVEAPPAVLLETARWQDTI